MSRLFSIPEIKKYIESQESRGDILYFLSEENIIKANQPKPKLEDEYCGFCGCEEGCCDKSECECDCCK